MTFVGIGWVGTNDAKNEYSVGCDDHFVADGGVGSAYYEAIQVQVH